MGISGFPSGHTRELCAGCGAAAQQWIESCDPPYNIEFVWEEDSFDEAKTRRAAKRLIDAGCVAVIGHLSSSAALVASEIYHQANIPYLAPGSTHPRLTANSFWNVLRVCGRDDELAAMLARVAAGSGWSRSAVVWQEITYGRTLASLLQESLRERGVETIARIPWSDPLSDKDAAALADSDALLFAGTYETGARLLGQLHAIGYRGAILMGDDAFIAELPVLVSGLTERTYIVSTSINRAHPEYDSFYQCYLARAGLEPGAYSVTSYVAMKLLLQAMDVLLREGSKAGVGEIRALAATEESLIGRLSFTPNGDLLAFPWDVYCIRDNRFVPASLEMEVY